MPDLTPTELATAIRADAKRRGIFLVDYGRLLGAKPDDIKNGLADPPRSQAAAYRIAALARRHFGYPDSWPQETLRPLVPANMAAIPVLGAAGGRSVEDCLDVDIESLNVPADMVDHLTRAFIISGDSMSPLLIEGDIVTVQPATRAIGGKLYVVGLADGPTVKGIRWTTRGAELHSINQNYEPLIGVTYTLVGLVTGRYRDYAPESRRRETVHDPEGLALEFC